MQNTQKTILFTIYYILGIISFLTETVPIFAIFLILSTIVLVEKEKISKKFAFLLSIIFIAGFFNCNHSLNNFDELSTLAPTQATINARIISIPTTNNSKKTKFYAKVRYIETLETRKSLNDLKTIVTIYDTKSNLQNLKMGDIVQIKGKLIKPSQGTNQYQFDYAEYLRNFDTYTLFTANEKSSWHIIQKAETPYWKTIQNINKTRCDIIKIHANYIKSPNIELLEGIVFGDDAVNPPDYIRTSFINSGLLHILAASGMNVTLIFGIWFFISQKLKINYRLSIIAGMLLILVYTAMTGFGPSIMRATLMLMFILFGKLINRQADSLALLFAVALILLTYDPLLVNNIGFQLSFAVTFGLLFMCPVLFNKIENKYLNILASATLVPVVAQLYAAPIQMYYFGTFATYSVFANIATIPLLTIASFVGFGSSIIALLPKFGTQICHISDILINPILTSIIFISDFFAKLNKSLLLVPQPDIFQIFVFYSLIISAVLIAILENKKFIIITTTVLFLTLITSLIPWNQKNCEIIFFDVQNADSALIKTPLNKYILIDTGKMPYKTFSPAKQIILQYLKAKGIKKLDALVVTHHDADHAGGTLEILKSIKVNEVYIPQPTEKTKLSTEIKKYFQQNGIIPSDSNIVIKEKDFQIEDITPKHKTNDDNEASLVDLLSYNNNKVLFLADEPENCFKFLPKEKIKDTKILKVAHHGANSSLNNNMLKTMGTEIAIISTGENIYGHPSEKTLKILKNNNVKTYRTDFNNSIKIVIKKDIIEVYTFNQVKKRFIKATTIME